MATDPSISLAVQNPQIDVGAIYARALQLKQAQQEMGINNALKSIFAQPGAVDQKTGLPTANALAAATRLNPAIGLKLTSEVGAVQEKAAQTAHAESEAQSGLREDQAAALSDALSVYDATLKDGNTTPDIAQTALRGTIKDYITGLPISQEAKDKAWAKIGGMGVDQLRALSVSQKVRDATAEDAQKVADQEKLLGEERTPATMNGKPVLVDKTGAVYDPNNSGEKLPVTGPIIKQEPGFNPEAAAAKAADRPPQLLQDTDGQQYLAYFGPKGTEPQYTDLQGGAYSPKGASHISSGAPRSASAMATQRYIQENPNASATDIAKFAGDYQRTVTAETADTKAEAAGLQNLGKMRSSVSQAEGNAAREANLVESLLKNGGIQGIPSALGKWQNSVRTGVFNDPDASAFQTAVESLKNEYVKVLSTTGGMSGGMSSDAARREADTYINPRLSQRQIEANIGVMKQSMANRTAAIDKAYSETKERVAKAGAGGSGAPAGGTPNISTKAAYEALTAGERYHWAGDPPGTYRTKK